MFINYNLDYIYKPMKLFSWITCTWIPTSIVCQWCHLIQKLHAFIWLLQFKTFRWNHATQLFTQLDCNFKKFLQFIEEVNWNTCTWITTTRQNQTIESNSLEYLCLYYNFNSKWIISINHGMSYTWITISILSRW